MHSVKILKIHRLSNSSFAPLNWTKRLYQKVLNTKTIEDFVFDNHCNSSQQSFLDSRFRGNDKSLPILCHSRESGNPGGLKFDYTTVFGFKNCYHKCFALFRGAKLDIFISLDFGSWRFDVWSSSFKRCAINFSTKHLTGRKTCRSLLSEDFSSPRWSLWPCR